MTSKQDTRLTLDNLEIQRFFWAPSFEIYNGVAGLYDQGPGGCGIEKNLLSKWREHFVDEDDMLEIRCSMLTPYKVLEASGHTAKFSDFIVSDLNNPNNLYRCDQLIENILNQRLLNEEDPKIITEYQKQIANVSDYTKEELIECIKKFDIKSPEGNPLSEPIAFNLMFNTRIGPGVNSIPGFLRPETAQGIFVNFPRLYEYNRCHLPFACVQIGVSYRNEIAPRNGLVRCREFVQAEIEHFCDPTLLNSFPKFETVKSLKIQFLSASNQEQNLPMVEMTIEEAVSNNIVCHQTMGYFLGRVYLFIRSLGIEHDKIRFRQHRVHEKAHYARDCWDCELVCSSTGGWLECVGIADRQSFDLTQHAMMTGKQGELNPKMIVKVPLENPISEEKIIINTNQRLLRTTYKKQYDSILSILESLNNERKEEMVLKYQEAEKMIGGKPKKPFDMTAVNSLPPEKKKEFDSLTSIEVEVEGQKIVLGYDVISFEKKVVTTNTRSFIPCVIEPSFGIGRIMTVLMEQAFYLRNIEGNDCRRVLRLPPFLAPIKCSIIPLSNKAASIEQITTIQKLFKKEHIPVQIDSSAATVGKRYARSDEVGTPFAITIDFQTAQDSTVTLRERDSMKQIRLTAVDAINVIKGIIEEKDSWNDAMTRFPSAQVNENQ